MFKKFKKKHIIYASLLIGIFSLFMFCTIAYSAINGTVKISGNAYARAEADVRITDFRIASSNNATSSYEEFGKNHVVTDVEIINSSSSISYYVEVSNYGANSVGIYEITGLPNGVSYTIEGYNLKDKICDSSSVCSGFFKQTYKITLNSSSGYTGSIKLDFDFRPFLNISYVGFSNQYLNEFIAGDSVSIDLSSDNKELVYAIGQEDFDYTYHSNILRFSEVWCDVEVGFLLSEDFSYTGNIQTYKVKADGVYKLETWGASGGDCSLSSAEDMSKLQMTGGNGGYSTGYVNLKRDDTIYVVVGGEGPGTNIPSVILTGGYNGGGDVANAFWNHVYGAGGGATHMASKTGLLKDLVSSKESVYLVAGGGGGSRNQPNSYTPEARYAYGGAGGGLTGGAAVGYGGDGIKYTCSTCVASQTGKDEQFGQGQSATGNGTGGGGWYGGSSGVNKSDSWYGGTVYIGAGGGGSGYIGGVSNGESISGDKQIPSYQNSSLMLGNDGNGYAKITPFALGNYNLIDFHGNNEDLSQYSFARKGEDLVIQLSNNYHDVVIENKDGSFYLDYSFDKNNKRIIINNVVEDLVVTLVGTFEVEADIYGSLTEIFVGLDFNNVCVGCSPITVDYYYKYSYEDDTAYYLYDSVVYNDVSDYIGYYIYADAEFESFDVKVVITGYNGYSVTKYGEAYTECFVGDTKVLVENGYKNIEDIKVGDYVYALDLNSNERFLRKVTRKFEGVSIDTYEITVNGEKIVATPKHEFYVVDKGWVRAYNLVEGDILNSYANGNLEITNIKYIKHKEPVKVYNLTVDGLHNFLIAKDQLLVHNSGSEQI